MIFASELDRHFNDFSGCVTARSSLIRSTSILNGPALLSPNMKPRALNSSGFTGQVSFTSLPNEVASNLSSGTLTSIHSSFFVWTVAR